MPKGLQPPLRCGGVGGDRQQPQGPALPEARVPKARGGRWGDGDGSQPGQAVVCCRPRGALRWLSNRFPFGVGADGQTTHQGAHGPRTQPGARRRGIGEACQSQDGTCGPAHGAGAGYHGRHTNGGGGSGGRHTECHCEHVSFLIGKYPKMGMDAIVQHLDRLDNQKDGLEEDIAGILDDQSEAERDMAELRPEQDRYREELEMALQKQQQVVDSLSHLVEDTSGRLKRLEESPLASGPELPARPATAELVERVKTLRSAMEKPMGGPAEAPYAPPRVDPGVLLFVPMFSESIMLREHTAPAGSRREGHATMDLRSPTVEMSHAARNPPTATAAQAAYEEEEIQTERVSGIPCL